MSLSLILIAHASTKAMRTGAFPGDDPLDARGLSEISGEAAGFLESRQGLSPARAVSSPMRCAVETAQVMGLEATVEPALADMDYGQWRGMRLSDLAARDPGALQAWLNDPATAPHGGEPFAALQCRVGNWIDGLEEQGCVVAITHAPVIRAALVHTLGLDTKAAFDLRIAPMDRIMLSKTRTGPWARAWA